jgi:hypothetical protein
VKHGALFAGAVIVGVGLILERLNAWPRLKNWLKGTTVIVHPPIPPHPPGA